jgi:hypothetical protein
VFESRGDQGWILGFEWDIDPAENGSLVVSEYSALGPENYWEKGWPFCITVYYPSEEGRRQETIKNARFERRMATKSRKERARTGQKQPRSRMPGAWIW